MCGKTLEVASGAYSAICNDYQCVTGPLWHEAPLLPLDVLDSDWSTKR